MEVPKKTLERLQADLKQRHDALNEILEGQVFTTMNETPWRHTMDSRRRENNRYIDAYALKMAIADFESIIKLIKSLK